MKNPNQKNKIKDIKIYPKNLNFEQPLGRFLIVLFRLFEDELVLKLHELGFKDISITDFNVLRFVDPKGIQASKIAELAGVSKQAMSKQILQLESRGLIKRRLDTQDLRAQVIHFSTHGKKVIKASIKIIIDIENKYEKIIGHEELINLKKKIYQLITHTQL